MINVMRERIELQSEFSHVNYWLTNICILCFIVKIYFTIIHGIVLQLLMNKHHVHNKQQHNHNFILKIQFKFYLKQTYLVWFCEIL